MYPIDKEFLAEHASKYAEAIYDKSEGLLRVFFGVIDEMVLGIAIPTGNLPQRVVYNGHKRKHALKYHAVNAPDVRILHADGPIEGCRHDWTLNVQRSLEKPT